jgi:hypothetical protein
MRLPIFNPCGGYLYYPYFTGNSFMVDFIPLLLEEELVLLNYSDG